MRTATDRATSRWMRVPWDEFDPVKGMKGSERASGDKVGLVNSLVCPIGEKGGEGKRRGISWSDPCPTGKVREQVQ